MTSHRGPSPADMAGESFAGWIPDPAARGQVAELLASGADPEGAAERIEAVVRAWPGVVDDPVALRRACAIAGVSRALTRSIARHPELLGPPLGSLPPALRYQQALVESAGDELCGEIGLAAAVASLSAAVDSIVEGALTTAREDIAERHPMASEIPMTVIAMGKWGARELNYSSDIDLVLAHDDGGDPTAGRAAALAVAGRLVTLLSEGGGDGVGLRVDLDLRPEGSIGPLSRSIESYGRYYERWGEAWELQALLKARPAAGDPELGARFSEMRDQVVWDRGLDTEALRNIRKIKEQAEGGADPADIKRSRGGIRDIEFSVQLLQLVHGRAEPELRAPATLDALDAMADHGFVEPDDHERLSDAYRFLRGLEHRIQLWDLRQTHRVPDDRDQLERIGRSLGLAPDPARQVTEKLSTVRGVVREAHERLYFRPILDALVGSPSARLGIEEATVRLEALGFSDVMAARAALGDLTSGLSRKSSAMRQMLPLMLDWISTSPNPDLGLAQLRNVLANTPDHSALVTLLQTNPLAGDRLCVLLGTSRLVGQLIDRIPEFVPRLADERSLGEIRPRAPEIARLIALLDSRPDPDAKVGTVRRFTRRRKLRIAARDILGEATVPETLIALTDTADAAVTGSLHVIADGAPQGFAVVGMGKWGGAELSYGSDLDVMYLFGAEGDRDQGLRLSTELARALSEPSRHGEAYRLDPDIRPEGRKGPIARSLDSYRRYYQEWAEPWEVLALVRARPIAGEPALMAEFAEMIIPVVWRKDRSEEFLRSIRDIKVRVEKERIPPGEDPDFHLKLGKGSLSDIEFLTQLLQVRHGFDDPGLRLTGTLGALSALGEASILESDEVEVLSQSYLFCTRVRLRLHLQAGKAVDSLPTDPAELVRLSSSLGFARAAELRDQYRRVTRRARRVFERRFYE